MAQKNGIPLDAPLPPKSKPYPPYWQACLDELTQAYDSICAYLAIRIERVTGNCTVDHFVAKSQRPALAYEWSNYRLACSAMNRNKREFDDVLDPFEIETGWFHLDLITGRIYPNPSLPCDTQDKVNATIKRLHLDKPDCREMRVSRFDEYITNQISASYLKKVAPFIWEEARRQELL